MARKLRIEYAGALYHVINRGNYRAWIFESKGARASFLDCLKQACESQDWCLHAWCLMGNHYHLLIETPVPNLVRGMKWLQSTFANRFNRFRKENGHVFQGRYKALLLDGDAVGPVCHYIHLNPARAGIVAPGALQEYPDSSFHQLWHPRRRWAFVDHRRSLESAGGFPDKPKGRALYRDYLCRLCGDEFEQQRLGFDEMCSGWAKGSNQFKAAVLAEHGDETAQKAVEAEASEVREPKWERGLATALKALGRKASDLKESRKGAAWKVATARWLRERYLAPHRWIAGRLNMGGASSVQTLVSRHRRQPVDLDVCWKKLKAMV